MIKLLRRFTNMFYPDKGGQTVTIRGDDLQPAYLDSTFQALIDQFNQVPEVNAVISYTADVISRIPKKLKNKNDEEVTSHWTLDLLNNPNENVNYELMMQNIASEYYATGNVYLNFSKPKGFSEIKNIYRLYSPYVQVWTNKTDANGNIPLDVDFRSVFIENYYFQESTKRYRYEKEEVLHIKDSNLNYTNGVYLYGQSRLLSANKAITSLEAMYDARVSIYQKHGAMVMISPEDDQTSFSDEEKRKMEHDFVNDYGIGKKQSPFYWTNKPASVTSINRNIAGLQLIPMSEHDFGILCAVLGGFPARLLNDTRATTYNNLETDTKNFYTKLVQPFLTFFWNAFNTYEPLGLQKEGLHYEADYSEIEVLQEDKRVQAEIKQAEYDLYNQMYQDGYITRNMVLESIGEEQRNESEFNELKDDADEEANQGS